MAFNLRVMLHVAGILGTVLVFAWCYVNTSYYATMLVLILILLAQVSALLRMVHATNRELVRFLDALKYLDFTQSFSASSGSASFRELGTAFNTVSERFRAARSDKEQLAAWLQAVIQHLPVAVLAMDEQEKILLSNTALMRLLGRTSAPGSLQLISDVNASLATTIRSLQPGKDLVLKLQKGAETLHVKLSCTLLRMSGQQQKLISIQNIEGELEGRELEAWQNLIRVMTHEIMNSVTPITSLAETAEDYVNESKLALHNCSDSKTMDSVAPLLEDAASAVATIGKRGQSLMRFVNSYRTLSRLPNPVPAWLRLNIAFHSVHELLGEQLRAAGVVLDMECKPQTLQIFVDAGQLEQALINLLRNAMEALTEIDSPRISLKASLEDGGVISICVGDNGCGISEENLENIFVPFFTSKRGGSGIGMSVVKQIVRANGGRISVASTPGLGSNIRLSFRS